MDITVKELIEKLQQFNQDAKVVSITVGKNNNWDYTSNPKLSTSKNMFGERVFIN